MNDSHQFKEIVRLILVGDSNVGKTSILNRYCYHRFNPQQPPTVGLEYGERITTINNQNVLIQLWDTAGQQKFKNITPSYYKSAMGIILVYSVDDKQSFNSVTVWLKQIKSYADEEIPVILVCNKLDLFKKQVSEKQSYDLADLYKLDLVMVSCKDNINIDKVKHTSFKQDRQKLNIKHNKGRSNLCSC